MLTTTGTLTKQAGNGVQTVFGFSFQLQALTDLVVTTYNALGVQSAPKIMGVDYTISYVIGAPSGTVTMTVAPVSGGFFQAQRTTDQTQQTSWPREGPSPAKNIEAAVDKLTALYQELNASLAPFLATGSAALTAAIAAALAAVNANIVVRQSGTFAARPAAPAIPTMYYSTDQKSVDYWDPVAGRWFTVG